MLYTHRRICAPACLRVEKGNSKGHAARIRTMGKPKGLETGAPIETGYYGCGFQFPPNAVEPPISVGRVSLCHRLPGAADPELLRGDVKVLGLKPRIEAAPWGPSVLQRFL